MPAMTATKLLPNKQSGGTTGYMSCGIVSRSSFLVFGIR
jgi:hypothetical protein